jgi:hypothetical protein
VATASRMSLPPSLFATPARAVLSDTPVKRSTFTNRRAAVSCGGVGASVAAVISARRDRGARRADRQAPPRSTGDWASAVIGAEMAAKVIAMTATSQDNRAVSDARMTGSSPVGMTPPAMTPAILLNPLSRMGYRRVTSEVGRSHKVGTEGNEPSAFSRLRSRAAETGALPAATPRAAGYRGSWTVLSSSTAGDRLERFWW